MTAELKSRGMMYRKELVSKPVRGRVGQSASRIGVKNLGVFCCTARLRGMVAVYRFLSYALKSTYQYISIISYAMLQQGTIDMVPISCHTPQLSLFSEKDAIYSRNLPALYNLCLYQRPAKCCRQVVKEKRKKLLLLISVMHEQ